MFKFKCQRFRGFEFLCLQTDININRETKHTHDYQDKQTHKSILCDDFNPLLKCRLQEAGSGKGSNPCLSEVNWSRDRRR